MNATPPRVLVVEDDPAIRRGMVAALAFAGYEVLEAGDGPRGLALAETAEIDLVLLDVVLPGTDGPEIIRRVRTRRAERGAEGFQFWCPERRGRHPGEFRAAAAWSAMQTMSIAARAAATAAESRSDFPTAASSAAKPAPSTAVCTD